MPYVYSTLSADNTYALYDNAGGAGGPQVQIAGVTIRGGSSVMQSGANVPGGLYTPFGVRTEVTDQQLDILESNTEFQNHVKRGFITVSNRKTQAEKVASSEMTKKDDAAQLVQSDYEPGGKRHNKQNESLNLKIKAERAKSIA